MTDIARDVRPGDLVRTSLISGYASYPGLQMYSTWYDGRHRDGDMVRIGYFAPEDLAVVLETRHSENGAKILVTGRDGQRVVGWVNCTRAFLVRA